MNPKLKELNFERLIIIEDQDDYKLYDFYIYESNNYEHKIKGFCVDCEKKDICDSKVGYNSKLTTVSHAAHSTDYIQSTERKEFNLNDWKEEGIMFVFESPGGDYGFYTEINFDGITKKPTKKWYWVHNKNEYIEYPTSFKSKEYNNLLRSIINTFKLKNAYVTNLIKCGLIDGKGRFNGIGAYRQKTIENCFENYLSIEISILNPKLIFTFGTKVDNKLRDLIKGEYEIINLPHPAKRMKNKYFKVLYFWLIAKALFKKDIINIKELDKLSYTFNNK